jgi:hypothetical protein
MLWEEFIMGKKEEVKVVVQPEYLRRITGYLVGNASMNFNDAKLAELKDRTKHTGRIGFQADTHIV